MFSKIFYKFFHDDDDDDSCVLLWLDFWVNNLKPVPLERV